MLEIAVLSLVVVEVRERHHEPAVVPQIGRGLAGVMHSDQPVRIADGGNQPAGIGVHSLPAEQLQGRMVQHDVACLTLGQVEDFFAPPPAEKSSPASGLDTLQERQVHPLGWLPGRQPESRTPQGRSVSPRWSRTRQAPLKSWPRV